MNNEAAIINALLQLKNEAALEAFQKPSLKNEFEYGERCGVIRGITLAIEKAQDILQQLERTDD